jgi:hypothetical protein
MPDLAELSVERERIKAKLNLMKHIINNFNEGDDLDELRLCRPDLISAYKEFDKIQSEIVPLASKLKKSQQNGSILKLWITIY